MPGEDPSPRARVVTLDGLSGSGKSTLARRLAAALGWTFVDSGAWYRALTFAVLEAEEDPRNADSVLSVLSQLDLAGQADGTVCLDGRALGAELRTARIDAAVSDVADHPSVRQALNQRLRSLRNSAQHPGLVADGRDAGSVIYPEASLKVFVDVSLEERARRRHQQALAIGQERAFADVLAGLRERDQRESERGAAAPRAHQGDRVLDNEKPSVEEAIRRLLDWVKSLGTQSP